MSFQNEPTPQKSEQTVESSTSESNEKLENTNTTTTTSYQQKQQQIMYTLPAPILSASVATSLQRSSGYICKGEIECNPKKLSQVERLRQQVSSSSSSSSTSQNNNNNNNDRTEVVEVNSAAELLKLENEERIELPKWAVKILSASASA